MSQETGDGQGFMDRLKSRLKLGETKVKEVVKEREDQIRGAVDKAEGFVDSKTKGKYHDKISKVGAKADEVIDKATKDDAAASGADAATAGAAEAGTTAGETAAGEPAAGETGTGATGTGRTGAGATDASAAETGAPAKPDAAGADGGPESKGASS